MAEHKGSGQKKSQEQETPREFPQLPPNYSNMDHSFSLQAIMEMQKTLGGLSGKIDSLDATIKELGKDVSRHGKWIYAATIIAALLFACVGFIAKVAWDVAKVKLGLQ